MRTTDYGSEFRNRIMESVSPTLLSSRALSALWRRELDIFQLQQA
jgi:hypothetical protein